MDFINGKPIQFHTIAVERRRKDKFYFKLLNFITIGQLAEKNAFQKMLQNCFILFN